MEVSITNFRGIEQESYSFSKGSNLLKGESGVGKTTVFEAIKWCLYGNMKDILPRGNDKAKIRVEVKVNGYTIARTNRPATVTVTSGEAKLYEGDEAKGKILQLFGTKALWETCSYLGQDQRNFLLQASQKEKTDIIKELLFDMTSEESEWYKDKFEKFKDGLKLDNAKVSGKIDTLREGISVIDEKPEDVELKKAKKREQDLLLYDKIDKKYKKTCVKIEEYDKFKEMKVERDKMAQKISLYPFKMSWKKFEKWREYWELKQKEKNLVKIEVKETDLTKEEINLQLKITEKNYEILKKFKLSTSEQVKDLYDTNMNKIKNRVLVEKNKQDRNKKKKLNLKLSSLISDLEEAQEELKDAKNRKIFSEVKGEDGKLDDKKCSTLISRFEEIRDGKIRECPVCSQKLIIGERGELKISELKGSSDAQKKIKILEWMMENKNKCMSLSREVHLLKREISDIPEVQKIEEDLEDFDQLEIDCKLLSKYEKEVEKLQDIQLMHNFLRLEEVRKRIDEIRFPDADYKFPIFPHTLGDTPDQYVDGYLEAKNTIEKYDQFVERYEIIDEEEYINKIEKRDTIQQELAKLDRIKDVLKLNQVRECLRQVSSNNQKINKAGILADKIESLVNQNLQLFLIDFNNLINDMVSCLIDEMSVTLSLFKTTKVTKKTKCNVNVEIIFKGHRVDNFSNLSGGQKNRLSLAFTLVFAKICNARFIFLDEFMSSLGEDLRNKCLVLVKSLREDGDFIMVNVCHETVEGYYDKVIEVIEK
jgi:energy-coupling factor transporter ATP-binding protein EcfA2